MKGIVRARMALAVALVIGLSVLAGGTAWMNGAEKDTIAVIAEADKNGEFPKPVVIIDIKNFKYSPDKVAVTPGTTVVWTQLDSSEHNVHITKNTKQNKLKEDIVSKMLGSGEKFAVTFNEAGTYSYKCDPHVFMSAKIIVQPEKK